jgi:hypothetical protein
MENSSDGPLNGLEGEAVGGSRILGFVCTRFVRIFNSETSKLDLKVPLKEQILSLYANEFVARTQYGHILGTGTYHSAPEGTTTADIQVK